MPDTFHNPQTSVSDEVKQPSFPESIDKVKEGKCLISSFKNLKQEEADKKIEFLRKEGLKWIRVPLPDEKFEIIFFKKFCSDVLVASNLRMRALGVSPGELSADEWKVLLKAYGSSDEKADSFADKVSKKSKDFEGGKVESFCEAMSDYYLTLLVEEMTQLTAEQQKLVLDNLGLAAHVAKKFIGRCNLDPQDIYGLAHLGLVKAALKFDPQRSPKFSSFAYTVIFNEIGTEVYKDKTQGRIRAAMRDPSTAKRFADEYDRISTHTDPATKALESVKQTLNNTEPVMSIEKIVESLLEQGDKKTEIPSSRPTKPVRDILTQLKEKMDQLDELQIQADAIAAKMEPIEAEISQLQGRLLPLLEDYKDRLARIKGIAAQIEETMERKSPTPTWTKFRDWAFAKFSSISDDLGKEARKMLEDCKRIIPSEKRLKITRESLDESWVSRIVTWAKGFLRWANETSRKSWSDIRKLEGLLDNGQ